MNTVTGVRTEKQDGYADGYFIRRAATERGLPCFTSLDTLGAVVDSLDVRARDYTVAPLLEYRNGKPGTEEVSSSIPWAAGR